MRDSVNMRAVEADMVTSSTSRRTAAGIAAQSW